jgi:threonine dehydratase
MQDREAVAGLSGRKAQESELPGLEEIRVARDLIASRVHRTPLLSSRALGAPWGARVHLKPENLQRAGSFKIRGALYAVLCARARGEIGKGGVLTYSSGNHGQAVALAAQVVGCRATIVVPEDIPNVKRCAIEGYGAEVTAAGRSSEDRRVAGLRLAEEMGARVIPPFDHPDILAGQGTVGLEILEDLRDLDAVIVPVGGGGLLGGISIAVKALRPDVKVVGVEPETGNDMQLSLAAGRRVTIPPPETLADGLRLQTPGELPFQAARQYVDAVWTVSDASIRDAQREILERAKLLVEPSGAVAAAALHGHGSALRGRSVVLVLSGGNTECRFPGETEA